jgi:hypothetical protein
LIELREPTFFFTVLNPPQSENLGAIGHRLCS